MVHIVDSILLVRALYQPNGQFKECYFNFKIPKSNISYFNPNVLNFGDDVWFSVVNTKSNLIGGRVRFM